MTPWNAIGRTGLLARAARASAAGLAAAAMLPLRAAALSTNPPSSPLALRPPRDVLQPSFFEEHGLSIALGAAALALGAAILAWRWRRPGAAAAESPETAARRALEALRGQPETPEQIAQLAQRLRCYLQILHGGPPEQWTTDELLERLRRAPAADPALTADLEALLRECEARSFAPTAGVGGAALGPRVFEMAARLEQERSRRQAPPGAPTPAPAGGAEAAPAA